MTDELVISQYGQHGWKWTIRNLDGYGSTYRTDGEGMGLYQLVIDPAGGESWRQIQGDAQFSLPADRGRAINKLNSGHQSKIVRESELSKLLGMF